MSKDICTLAMRGGRLILKLPDDVKEREQGWHVGDKVEVEYDPKNDIVVARPVESDLISRILKDDPEALESYRS